MNRFLKKTTPIKRLLLLNAVAGGENLTEYTATGNPVTFSTDVAKALKECTVSFSPVQSGSGDPSPENVRPITGWTGLNVGQTGKNLIDDSKKYQSSPTTVYIGATDNSRNIYLQAGKYTVTRDFNGETIGLYYIKRDASSEKTIFNTSTTDLTKTITIAESGYYGFFAYRGSGSGGANSSDIKKVMIEVGETASEYEPYSGTSVSVTFPAEPGTVYGGSLDLTTGVLTVEYGFVKAKWSDFTQISEQNDYVCKTISVGGATDTSGGTVISNTAKKQWTSYNDTPHIYISSEIARLFLPNATSGDLEVEIAYKLATPLTYQLIPQQITSLIGDNTIWSDANGNTTVKYLKKVTS